MSDELMTVGELRQQLEGLSDNTKISFAGGLNFYRFNRVDDDEVFLEFNEPQGFLEDSFKKRNPNVKVVFISDDVEWDEGGIVGGPVDVCVR